MITSVVICIENNLRMEDVQVFFGLLKLESLKYYMYEDSISFIRCFLIIACKYIGDFN